MLKSQVFIVREREICAAKRYFSSRALFQTQKPSCMCSHTFTSAQHELTYFPHNTHCTSCPCFVFRGWKGLGSFTRIWHAPTRIRRPTNHLRPHTDLHCTSRPLLR